MYTFVVAITVSSLVALAVGAGLGICKRDEDWYEAPIRCLMLGVVVALGFYALHLDVTGAASTGPLDDNLEVVRQWPHPGRDYILLVSCVVMAALSSLVAHRVANR